ncbi:MAG: hypothetical protein AAFR73_13050 [Pseudomonadota bacterium]
MRFVLTLVLLAIAGFGGWIAGSLHPAPQAILAPIQQVLAGETVETPEDVQDDEAGLEDEVAADADVEPDIAAPVLTPAPSPAPSGTDKAALLAQYRTWISEARGAHPYPESEDRMYAVMMCESGGNAEIVNPAGPYIGLFQYVAGTWNGDWNDYRNDGITNPRAQIFATAQAWSIGMQSHWGCYTRAH